MAITVTMIEEKEFKTKVRGYDPLEVDEFLDAICDEMENMGQTIQQLRDQLKQAQQSPAPFMPAAAPPVMPLSPVGPREAALPGDLEAAKQLLEKTQKACDETLAEAKKRAEDIVKEAEESVPDPELEGLDAQKEKLQAEIEALKEEAQKFKRRFQSMLQDQNEILESELSE
ncbi:MAG: DivIVA domain-containing protein [Eubacteriales bacterium]|nr:DivIVA domain-containing protein [Eubacteriales bacterium]